MEKAGLITNPAKNALPTFEIHNLLFETPLSENDDGVGEGSS